LGGPQLTREPRQPYHPCPLHHRDRGTISNSDGRKSIVGLHALTCDSMGSARTSTLVYRSTAGCREARTGRKAMRGTVRAYSPANKSGAEVRPHKQKLKGTNSRAGASHNVRVLGGQQDMQQNCAAKLRIHGAVSAHACGRRERMRARYSSNGLEGGAQGTCVCVLAPRALARVGPARGLVGIEPPTRTPLSPIASFSLFFAETDFALA
jgi:hypothetical protein